MAPMMRLILGLGVLVLILITVALGLPGHVTVARSVVINAPEYAVFPYMNNLRRFAEWSPWAARDPNMKVTYSGAPEGVGAKIDWESGRPSVGTGSMEIVGSESPRKIDLDVNYNGLAGTAGYELSPAGAGSKITWTFGYETGSNPLRRWKALMLDGFVGSEYQTGLDKLKVRVEADRAPSVAQPVPAPQAPAAAPSAPGPGAAAPGGQSAVTRTPAAPENPGTTPQ